jgi:hypothetical protein
MEFHLSLDITTFLNNIVHFDDIKCHLLTPTERLTLLFNSNYRIVMRYFQRDLMKSRLSLGT